MRMGTITEELVYKRDDDGTLWSKKDWGCSVHCVVNGWSISSADRDWYGAYKGAIEGAKVALEQEPGKHKP